MKNMSIKLFIQAILKFTFGVVLVGVLIFLPAGNLEFFNGWLFMGILFVPMFLVGQKVIDTGLYGIVRHPMYSVTLLLFLSMPLVLGSVYSFVIFLCYPFIIAKRIKSEEEFLEKELVGYKEYKQKV